MDTDIKKKAIIVLSGGQDSATCAFIARDAGYELHAVTFDYGQRHKAELDAALQIGDLVGVASHETVNLGFGILKSASPLVSNSKLEQYADHRSLPGGIEKTFVPMRNQLFLTLAANRAVAHDAQAVYTGVCQEDFGGYPDCRKVFIDALQDAINLSNEGAAKPIEIVTPLMYLTKAESVILSTTMQGCYAALGCTHTAYDGAYPPTGHDHATLLRAKGFEEAGLPDPLVLRAVREGLMEKPATANYSEEAIWRALPYLKGRGDLAMSLPASGERHDA